MQSYKIIQFDKNNGSIAVQFSQEFAPVQVDVPINEDGKYITGEELDAYVRGFIPTWFLDRKAKIENGIPNEADIEALVVPPDQIQGTELSQATEINDSIFTFENDEAEKLIAAALVKWGVLQHDPTVIENTKL